MKNKKEAEPMGTGSHLESPAYKGDLLHYIKVRQEEEETKKNKDKKLASILDEAIFHLENLTGLKND